jgi:GNAT superfamily N-acetyltransferase
MARAKPFRAEAHDGASKETATAVGSDAAELELAEARYIQSIGGSLEQHPEGLIVVHPRLAHSALNGVRNLTSSKETVGAFVDGVEARFRAQQTPFSIVTTPVSEPPEACALLERRGYRCASRWMWMEAQESVQPGPHDSAIVAGPTGDFEEWAETEAALMAIPSQLEFLAGLARASASAPRHTILLARYRGRAAGACEVTADGAVAFIRHYGVLKEFRPKGVARALLASACQTIGDFEGKRVATRVFAGTGADLLLERYGFLRSHVSDEYVREPPLFPMD